MATEMKPTAAIERIEIPRAPAGIQLPRIEITTINQVVEMATYLAKSGTLGETMTPEKAMAIMLVGAELGIPPMTALRTIYLVEGRPFMSADLIVAMILRSGRAEYWHVVESDDTHCTISTQRAYATSPRSLTWTIEHAKALGLTSKDNWHYKAVMLRHRCSAELGRDVYPDVTLGICIPDEEDEVRRGAARVETLGLRVPEIVPLSEPDCPPEDGDGKPAAPQPGKPKPASKPSKVSTRIAKAGPGHEEGPIEPAADAEPAAKPGDDSPMNDAQLRVFWARTKKVCGDLGMADDLKDLCIHECVFERFGLKSIAAMTVGQGRKMVNSDGWREALYGQMAAWQVANVMDAVVVAGAADE